MFPAGFVWGAATSAYQIEGAWNADGKGESIWDRFCHTRGRVSGGQTGDVACDHYHRVEQDIALMADLGLQAYRFSIAWPRIFPTGGGPPNPHGVDFYKRLIVALRERGILAMATLYHWDLPQALQARGGWANRETATRFAEYAAYCFAQFGADVPLWATLNEPALITLAGHVAGTKAPGLRRPWLLPPVVHHLLLAHGLAVRAFREAMPRPNDRAGQQGIGIVLNLRPCHPASPLPADRVAAQRVDGLLNRLFLEPLFRANYPQDVRGFLRRRMLRLPIRAGDMEQIAQPLDFLGINVYGRSVCQARPRNPLLGARVIRPASPTTAMGWEIYPPCVYEVLEQARGYTDLPLYITENGAAFDDTVGPDGGVDDGERIAFLRAHLAEALRAIQDGVNLKGYFVWSLLDNFEWEEGYGPRFGLVHVDRTTLTRTPKRSAYWYRAISNNNGLEKDLDADYIYPRGGNP